MTVGNPNAQVIPVPGIPKPDPGTPSPELMAREGRVQLSYRVASSENPGQPRVTLVFGGCRIHRFGSPNDEGLPTHPLFGKGLAFYDVMEATSTEWLHQHGGAGWRHFLVTFHDSTFECVAKSVTLAP